VDADVVLAPDGTGIVCNPVERAAAPAVESPVEPGRVGTDEIAAAAEGVVAGELAAVEDSQPVNAKERMSTTPMPCDSERFERDSARGVGTCSHYRSATMLTNVHPMLRGELLPPFSVTLSIRHQKRSGCQ
jgi:hypothetical protein